MLFRTKFIAAFTALAGVAIACASMLTLSAQRSELHQKRTDLAYESLSGYLELSSSIFRTFKQSRRDLISGNGAFEFDMVAARQSIMETLDQIELVVQQEARTADDSQEFRGLDNVEELRVKTTQALDAVETASRLILSGQTTQGRRQAVEVLEGQVDAEIAILIEQAIRAERTGLQAAQAQFRRFHEWGRWVAWISVAIAVTLSTLVLVTLIRRFRLGMVALDQGASEYAKGNLSHVIELQGRDELSAVANRFSGMAEQLLAQRKALEAIRRDLEDRVEARTLELSEANKELRERDEMRRQFFADIGHELRTPVTAIRGEAEVALRGSSEDGTAYRDALSTIVSLSEELTESVSDLFLVAREQAGVLDFRNGETDLNEAARLGIKQMQSLIASKGALILENLAAHSVSVEGDGHRLAQLVRILISNALAHGPDGVRIEIQTRQEDGEGILAVSDNGPGIAEKDKKRIFERYDRGHQNLKRPASGTGLGLAIAKSITQAHGGQIGIENATHTGARFAARFPLAAR